MNKILEALEKIKNKEILIDIEMTNTFYNEYEDLHNSFSIIEDALKEIKVYKDIEKELCIDLITLFKALKEQTSIYYIDRDNIVEFKCFCNEYAYHYKNVDFKYKSLNIYTDVCHLENRLYFKDYGKTWALSRKELEKKL